MQATICILYFIHWMYYQFQWYLCIIVTQLIEFWMDFDLGICLMIKLKMERIAPNIRVEWVVIFSVLQATLKLSWQHCKNNHQIWFEMKYMLKRYIANITKWTDVPNSNMSKYPLVDAPARLSQWLFLFTVNNHQLKT